MSSSLAGGRPEQRQRKRQDVVAVLRLDRVHRAADQQRDRAVIPIASQARAAKSSVGGDMGAGSRVDAGNVPSPTIQSEVQTSDQPSAIRWKARYSAGQWSRPGHPGRYRWRARGDRAAPRDGAEHPQANDLMEVSRETKLEVMRRQADQAAEQAERMNELLARVVRLTEPSSAQRSSVRRRAPQARALRARGGRGACGDRRGDRRRRVRRGRRGSEGARRDRSRAVSRPDAGLCDRCRHPAPDPRHARLSLLALRAVEDRPGLPPLSAAARAKLPRFPETTSGNG